MMTEQEKQKLIDELLSKKGDDLSRALGEVLQPEHNLHNEDGYKANACITFCTKCKLEMMEFAVPKSRPTMHFERKCKFADPIPLTPDNAYKWRNWAVEKFGKCEYVKALLAVFDVKWNPADIDFTVVCGLFACELKPEHHLKAAATLNIRSK